MDSAECVISFFVLLLWDEKLRAAMRQCRALWGLGCGFCTKCDVTVAWGKMAGKLSWVLFEIIVSCLLVLFS